MRSAGPLGVLVATIASVPWGGRPRPGAEPPDVRVRTIADGPTVERRRRPRRDGFGGVLGVSLLISVAVHAVVFAWIPSVGIDDLDSHHGALVAVRLAPTVEVAAPPPEVVRPAPPRPPRVDVSPALTVAPTTLEAHPITGLAPPPTLEQRLDERPTYVPYEVPPQLLNRAEVERRLLGAYPARLRGSGIDGFLLVWAYVDEHGDVTRALIRTSSGHPAMDSAAIEVVRAMEFAPALNRDRPTGVWVAQTVSMKVQREARRRWLGPGL